MKRRLEVRNGERERIRNLRNIRLKEGKAPCIKNEKRINRQNKYTHHMHYTHSIALKYIACKGCAKEIHNGYVRKLCVRTGNAFR